MHRPSASTATTTPSTRSSSGPGVTPASSERRPGKSYPRAGRTYCVDGLKEGRPTLLFGGRPRETRTCPDGTFPAPLGRNTGDRGQQPGGDGVRKSSTWVDQGRSVTMAGGNWNNPWKLTTIALALVGATALATGLVVANRTGKAADKHASVADKQPANVTAPGSAATRVAHAPAAPTTPAVPSQSAYGA